MGYHGAEFLEDNYYFNLLQTFIVSHSIIRLYVCYVGKYAI